MTKKTTFKPIICRFFAKTAFFSPFCDFLLTRGPLTRDTMATAQFSTLKRRLAAFLGQTATRPNLLTPMLITC